LKAAKATVEAVVTSIVAAKAGAVSVWAWVAINVVMTYVL